MKKIKLDQGKLLGFKILRQAPKIGGKPKSAITGNTIKGKIGGKVGSKTMNKIGAKVGLKGR